MKMKTDNKVFVVDGNWYLHRVWFTMKTSRPYEEVLPYGFVGLICKDACAVRATHVVVAFDGASNFRFKLFESYKANRVKNETGAVADEDYDGDGVPQSKDIYSYLPAVFRYLEASGIAWVTHKKFEADDVLASAAVQYVALGATVVLGAKDKDGYQCLGPKVRMYDSSAIPEPRYITQATAEKRKGVKVGQMIELQTLIGDRIDNIPVLMSEGRAKKILLTYGSISQWFKQSKGDERVWLRAHQTALKLNKQLVTLVTDVAVPEIETLKVAKLKREDWPKAWYAYQSYLYPKSKGLF